MARPYGDEFIQPLPARRLDLGLTYGDLPMLSLSIQELHLSLRQGTIPDRQFIEDTIEVITVQC